MKVRFKDISHCNTTRKMVVNNPKKQEFYRKMAEYNPENVIIYE